MKIGIDFDGVLADGKGIPRKHGFMNWKPKEYAVEAVKFLQGLGYECYVLTARKEGEWPGIGKWLKKYKFPKMRITNKKMKAVVYIDDRAIRFTNWQDICKLFG